MLVLVLYMQGQGYNQPLVRGGGVGVGTIFTPIEAAPRTVAAPIAVRNKNSSRTHARAQYLVGVATIARHE